MDNQKIMRFLFFLVPVLLVLSIWWNVFVPFIFIALLYLMVLVLRSGFVKTMLTKLREPIIYYQPPQQQSTEPEPPPRTNPQPGFDLTAQEYQRYQQGYQAPAPQRHAKMRESTLPKQGHPLDYEQPQAQYPEQEPPLQY